MLKMIKHLQKQYFKRLQEKDKWKAISKSVGMKVKNQNQYELACMGASQEHIDKNIPSELYEQAIRFNRDIQELIWEEQLKQG